MTCIVGLIEKEKVYIGADSASVAGLHTILTKNPKVFKKEDFVIGCTSSFRMIQLLKYSFYPPEMDDRDDLHRYMCIDFIEAVKQCFREGGYMMKTTEGEDKGGVFLVGFQGRLFTIYDDFQVHESIEPYAAIGCGTEYAMGSLNTTLDMRMKSEKRLLKALEAAERHSGGVLSPFIIEKI